jgi:hypothetical protein
MDEVDFDADLFLRCLQSEIQGSLSDLTLMSRAKHWCFTLNNYEEENIQKICDNSDFFEYAVFGKEVGDTGTPHLQGFVTFKTRVRRNFCIEKIGQAHFTVARNVENSIEYCKKDGDFIEIGARNSTSKGSRSDLEGFKLAVALGCHDMKKLREDFSDVVAKYPKFASDYLQDHLPQKLVEFFPLKDWQQALYDALKHEPDSRTIQFIVDHKGNAGKSWFGHYYTFLHENSQVLLPGKKADMAYALNPLIRVLFVDAPRAKQGEFIQYDFLEDVKNGFVFSTKYESRVKNLGPCHVVVFMNEQPDMNKLSKDRYVVRVVG